MLKQGKLDVVSANIARTMVQRFSHEEAVDEDDALDDELNGDDVDFWRDIEEDSESEVEFGDDEDDDDTDDAYNDDYDDDDIDGISNGDGEDEGDGEGDDDDDIDAGGGADARDVEVEVDFRDVLHASKLRSKGKSLFYGH